MIPAIDVTKLPGAAQKILDPQSPPQLRAAAAKAVVPGLRPADLLVVVALLSEGTDPASEIARQTLAKLPGPILNGALSADLDPFVLHKLAPVYVDNAEVMERMLAQPRIALETVADAASRCSEHVAELIAVNEQRMLAHPPIIERLYMNKATRMSTADRIIEIAVRNKLDLKGIPAYKEVAIAIGQELIEEAQAEPTPYDILFRETLDEGAKVAFNPAAEDTHVIDDEGEEKVSDKFLPLYARIAKMSISQKIRASMVGSAADRMILMRDGNRLVAVAAIRAHSCKSPRSFASARAASFPKKYCERSRSTRYWIKNYQVKLNLIQNPRTPFPMAARLVPYLRESELKAVAKSKNVAGNIAQAAKQQLDRKKNKLAYLPDAPDFASGPRGVEQRENHVRDFVGRTETAERRARSEAMGAQGSASASGSATMPRATMLMRT